MKSRGIFLSDLGKSIRRRRRQMLLLGVISFLSAFFLLGMYLFQENSENYLFAAHQVAYGDWCIAEIVVCIARYVLVKTDILDADECWSLWEIYLPFAMISVLGMTLLHMGRDIL